MQDYVTKYSLKRHCPQTSFSRKNSLGAKFSRGTENPPMSTTKTLTITVWREAWNCVSELVRVLTGILCPFWYLSLCPCWGDILFDLGNGDIAHSAGSTILLHWILDWTGLWILDWTGLWILDWTLTALLF